MAPPAGPSRYDIDMRAITTVLVIARKPISLRSVAYYYRRFTGENCIAEFATQYQSYIANRKFCVANCDAIPVILCPAMVVTSTSSSRIREGKVSLSRQSVNVVRPAVVDDPDRILLASASSVGAHLRETVSNAQLSDGRLGLSIIEAGGRHRQQLVPRIL